MLNGKRSFSPELAMMMEAALGVDAAPLLAMQNEYDMQMAERDASFNMNECTVRDLVLMLMEERGIILKILRNDCFCLNIYKKVGACARNYK